MKKEGIVNEPDAADRRLRRAEYESGETSIGRQVDRGIERTRTDSRSAERDTAASAR